MANPQPDKFTKIANELLDAIIQTRIPAETRRVFDYIMRNTYGYSRKTFQTTQRKISNDLKTKQQRVYEAIKWLHERNMIINTKNRVDLNRDCLIILGIQKDYDRWNINTEKRVITEKRVDNDTVFRKTIIYKEKRKIRGNVKNDTEKRVDRYIPPTGDELKNNGHQWIDAPSWDEFVNHRKDIKKPLTELAVKKAIILLSNYKTQQKEIIDKAILSGWTGLFAPKKSEFKNITTDIKFNNPEEDRQKWNM